jgi:hypothetical protein
MKLFEAAGILLNHIVLFSCIILTVWLPVNLLIEFQVHGMDEEEAIMATIRMNMWFAGVLGPIPAGAVVYAAARIKQGKSVSYGEAMSVGLRSWGRLFGARLVAGIFIALGLLLFILPGIYLLVRWALLDTAVILETAGISESRRRSSQLVRGSEFQIIGTAILFFLGLFMLGTVVGVPLEMMNAMNNFFVSAIVDCVMDVAYGVMGIALFLYYWEARQKELADELPDSTMSDSDDSGEQPQWLDDIPDDRNPYRSPLG